MYAYKGFPEWLLVFLESFGHRSHFVTPLKICLPEHYVSQRVIVLLYDD
jgi:hypothetical protein